MTFPLGGSAGRPVTAALAVFVTVLTVTTAGADVRTPTKNIWGGSWRPYAPSYHVSKPVALRIPMPDGVQLAGEAQYPTVRKTGLRAPGRFPVILELTPYAFTHDEKPSLFPKYGYIAVQVNERGTWGSGGQRRNYAPQEGRDGAAVVRWLAKHLPQSDGRVGMTGCSSPGKSQLLTAEYIGPNSPLKAIAPESAPQAGGTEDTLREAILVNGVPGPTSLLIGAGMVGLEGGSRPVPQYPQMAASWQSGGSWAYDRSSTYASVSYPARRIVHNGIPALLWSGTKDIVPNGTMSMYVALQNAYRGRNWRLPMTPHQRPTGRYQVVMNDQPHCVRHDFTLLLRWYDTWVKGEHTGLAKTITPIHFIEQPTGRWINAGRYPFTARYRRLFLSPGHELGSRPAGTGTAPLVFGPPSSVDGSVAFTSQRLRRGTDLAGGSSATVYASTLGRNLHLVATLQDVAPNGLATTIADGNVVGSLGRETTTGPNAKQVWRDANGDVIKPYYRMRSDHYLVPGRVYRFDIRIGTSVWRVEKGHALRLRLSTQVDPRLCRGLLGHEPCFFTSPQMKSLPGEYTLRFGGAHPSRVNLPLIRPGQLTATTSGFTPTSPIYREPLNWG